MSAKLPKFTLYTNHGCPWAHRAHIALTALGLPYEEVIIDLEKPREPWYLEVNPRGLVPSLKIESEGTSQILTESAIVSNFLLDLAHSLPTPYSTIAARLNPTPTSLESSLYRAKAAFTVDTFATKYIPLLFQLLGFKAHGPGEDNASVATKFLETVGKELEPLFANAAPFYGGSSEVTVVEVLNGPFVLRSYAYINGGLVEGSVGTQLAEKYPNFDKWAKAVIASDVVTAGIWNEKENIEKTKARLEKLKAKA